MLCNSISRQRYYFISSILYNITIEFCSKQVVFVCISGISGEVAINGEGNRVPVFVFSNRQHGRLFAIVEIDQTKANNESVTIYNVTTVWPNGTTTVPRDTPKCGFQGEKCLKTPEGECIRFMRSSLFFKFDSSSRVNLKLT